jgi:alanine racemase
MLRIPVETTTARAAAVLPPACRLIAVVKSDGYGHGMARVARTALAAGADELAVANVHEGAALRVAGVNAPILIAGPVPPDAAGDVVQHGLIASLGCFELAAALARVTTCPRSGSSC